MNIARWIPGLAAARTYKASFLPHDLAAGITLGAVMVPVGLAYGELAGLPLAGLYGSMLPLLAYALFGSSRQLVVGPDTAMAAIVAVAVAPLAVGDAGRLALLWAMLKGWNAFNEAHARPYIIFADLASLARRQTRFALLASLADIMNLRGDYALLPEDALIRVVFELEADARVFAEAVQARRTAREGGWAGQWGFTFNSEMESTIRTVLPSTKPRAPRAQKSVKQ